jgi:SAM-dependent methyltransferase
MRLCARSPAVRRRLWRWWYQRLVRRGPDARWTFMNYGWQPPAGADATLDRADEPDRAGIEIYRRVVSPVRLAGREVLEVGAGRGGGASYLARYHAPARVVAVDYAPAAIAWCRERHRSVANLEFAAGEAERLPLPEASFDAVVNIESSHCYGRVERFLTEVVRVLRPGGCFLFADARRAEELAGLAAALGATPGWCETDQEDLTPGVVAALAAEDGRKRQLMRDVLPDGGSRVFGEFAALRGTTMFAGLQSGRFRYHRWAWRKHGP